MANVYVIISIAVVACTFMTSPVVCRPQDKSCAIYSGGCAFHVILVGKECSADSVQDIPYPSSYNLQADDPKSSYYGAYQVDPSHNEVNKEQLQVDKAVRDELETQSKRLSDLDEKLTKMMEGLSVHTLRYFRKIMGGMDNMKEAVRAINQQVEEGTAAAAAGRSERSTDPCPPQFATLGTWGSCYHFSNFNDTWMEAGEYCSAFGASLVAIETEKEAYILDGLIKSNPELQVPKGWWTSGNYVARSQQWVWMGKRHARPLEATYQRWDEGEPNARSTMHCMLMYREANYRWHDGMCSDNHNFICELPVNGRGSRET